MISLWIGCKNVIFNCGKTMKNLWKPILTENQHSKKIYISYDSVDNFVNDLQKYEILKLENEKLGILKYLNLF
jgi:hypothetical protein